MTSTTASVVSITQNLPDVKMGARRISFSVDLGEVGFRRFLSNLPHGQAHHYEEQARALKTNAVEVMMPAECADTFDLSNPVKAIEEMSAISRHHHINTTTYILDNVAKAVQAAMDKAV